MQRLQSDNDFLVDKHGLCSRQLQDQDMNLTNNVDVSNILNLFILFIAFDIKFVFKLNYAYCFIMQYL